MNLTGKLAGGRKAFRQQTWGKAFDLLAAADRETPLEALDREMLAKAAYLTGDDTKSSEYWTQAHQDFQNRGEVAKASRCAFWLGFVLMMKGDIAQGSGWIARACRLVSNMQQECVEMGFVQIPEALQFLRQGDTENAYKSFSRAGEIGHRFNSPDLVTMARLGRGQALIQENNITDGITLLDEAMIAVVSSETSPIVSGIVYCAVIDTCQKIYDLRRAQEWTLALSRWCESQPDLVPFRGQCLVRRAEIMQFHGKWPDAMDELKQACKQTHLSSPPATGEAYYLQGELYRMLGDLSQAEEMFQQASKWGRKPQPGLALLRLSQNKIDVAETAIRNVEEESRGPMARSGILPAFIEIMLAAGFMNEAQTASEELTAIAADFHAPLLQGIAERAAGNVLLVKKKPRAALDKLLGAWSILKRIEAQYESARTRVLIGLAYRDLADVDTAEMELEAARWLFRKLGAKPDLARLDLLSPNFAAAPAQGLTPREMEVLSMLATGKTNKIIASSLFISERTVDRHVSNILSKLNVPTRAAATAYAYEHHLV